MREGPSGEWNRSAQRSTTKSRHFPFPIDLYGMMMQQTPSPPPEDLLQALREMIRNPVRTIAPPWSWKAAACTAVVRAIAFFATNLQSGRDKATKAMLVEAVFAIFAGGLIGAISQHLRRARPLWATALLICAALPAVMTLAQFGVHHLAKTPHESGGLVASFCLAALAAAYTWYAMRHGAMLGGIDQTTVLHDLRSLPHITLGFLLAGPRLISTMLRHKEVSH
jgi:hypothetical protein